MNRLGLPRHLGAYRASVDQSRDAARQGRVPQNLALENGIGFEPGKWASFSRPTGRYREFLWALTA